MAQGTDADLRSELEALHAKWMKAFDSGEGATMDQIEMDNLKKGKNRRRKKELLRKEK